MFGDIFKAIAIGSILPMFTGGGKETTDEYGRVRTTDDDGLMSKIFGAGGGMFENLLMSKFTEGGKASSRVKGYMPDIEGLLETAAMKGAGSVDKLHAVNPKDNDRAMEMLLTKMITSPVYSERIIG